MGIHTPTLGRRGRWVPGLSLRGEREAETTAATLRLEEGERGDVK